MQLLGWWDVECRGLAQHSTYPFALRARSHPVDRGRVVVSYALRSVVMSRGRLSEQEASKRQATG